MAQITWVMTKRTIRNSSRKCRNVLAPTWIRELARTRIMWIMMREKWSSMRIKILLRASIVNLESLLLINILIDSSQNHKDGKGHHQVSFQTTCLHCKIMRITKMNRGKMNIQITKLSVLMIKKIMKKIKTILTIKDFRRYQLIQMFQLLPQ